MRKILAAFAFILTSASLLSQAPFPDSKEINQFLGSTTCIVLEDKTYSAYNVYIRKAVEEYWKITPCEFITYSVFKERSHNPQWSFLLLTETSFDRDKSGSAYNFLNLLQGKDVEGISDMPEICAVPLSFAGQDDMEYGYKLGAILSFIQNHALTISREPSQTGRRYLRYYNKNVPEVKNKLLLVMQRDLSPELNSIDRLTAVYKHRIEIVPEDTIIKAIRERKPGTLILHMVSPPGKAEAGYCFKMFIGTDDAEMYYYNQHLISSNSPKGLLISDLKRLSRF